ncbi:MAG: ImmA/IrrE family metallo-endopeptidase [Gemmatimonadaceae bacterium]
MIRPDVNPKLLRWARQRANLTAEDLARRFPKLNAWERGDGNPTLKQLESLAKATYAPLGYFFLAEPPVETLPIPDFRTGRKGNAARPSPNLLDTVYLCQQRQSWYHDYARSVGEEERAFVGSLTLRASIESAATTIRDTLEFDLEARRQCPTWEDALRQFIAQADTLGILVMCSGVVLNNTHRKLDPNEFRGFAITDDLAPLVFINGADTKSAQMFTLAHELGHLWLGRSALDDAQVSSTDIDGAERWCNNVAAELLVPLKALEREYHPRSELNDEMRRLARRFKVSTLVILRRIFDTGAISRKRFHEAYTAEVARLPQRSVSGGGDFYRTEAVRVSKRFATALIANTLEGHTLYRDAYRMLGISKAKTFNELGRHLQFNI